jgi:hypothetical protein
MNSATTKILLICSAQVIILLKSAFRHQPHGLKLKLNYKSNESDKGNYLFT